MKFTTEQVAFMEQIGISIDFSKPLHNGDYEQIEEKVSTHLQQYGFDKDYMPTKDGAMCESILDVSTSLPPDRGGSCPAEQD